MVDIVVEDGTGIVTANAYATVAEVDNILSYHFHATGWVLLSDEDKEKLVIWATHILDTRVKWHGKKLHDSQGLGWPRTGARDREGICIDDDAVPNAVKQAVAVLANHLITDNPNEVNSSNNLTMLQADVVTLRFDPYATVYKFPDAISFILRGLGFSSMGSGGPKRIIKH